MHSKNTLAEAVSRFGVSTKAKLSDKGASGAPEDQLRAPLETLLTDLAALLKFKSNDVVPKGESSLPHLKTRPDYAITVSDALVGFIEVKAPHKVADPRNSKDEHDRKQWGKLKSLPNLMYTNGGTFSLWRDGKLIGDIVHLRGDVETSGAKLEAPSSLQSLFSDFLRWKPIPPASPRALAEVSAKLCGLLRDEVTEQMALGTLALTDLAADWRRYLFPEASDDEFADGYAQAVTFGLLMARAKGISLTNGLDQVAKSLNQTNTVIGAAFRVLTDNSDGQEALKTSLGTLTRVLDAVDWKINAKGEPDAWLYFYEHFLEVYDNDLRKLTGSYYTPPEVVTCMVRLVDEALRDPSRFGVVEGLASKDVTLADPAVGTGTFLLGVFRRIAENTTLDQGAGSVPGVIKDALKRIIGFELQFGPFAVAQLRILAEMADLLEVKGTVPSSVRLRLYVTDTLSNPEEDVGHIPQILKPLAESRKLANDIKRSEPITVVIGNPPYKDKAGGMGGWVEAGSEGTKAPLEHWIPPADWHLGHHARHLRNLYIYFWRWATWKVFGDGSAAPQAAPDRKGIVCFITVAGFINGPGFAAMRADMRRTADEIWIINCSPEGYQPNISTRIFQGVQQPICIVLMARTGASEYTTSARVRFRSLPLGGREAKFQNLAELTLDADGWEDCPTDVRSAFLPVAAVWGTYPSLESLFIYSGTGVMIGRTWIVSPDKESLEKRWKTLTSEKNLARKEVLFHPHLKGKVYGDRYSGKILAEGLFGHKHRPIAVASDKGDVITPVRYGFRSFDRQWIIPDNRLINRPNPTHWDHYSAKQVYLTALMQHSPNNGPALTATALIPDVHHYKGSFGGRAFPLWADPAATTSNIQPTICEALSTAYSEPVSGDDVFAYVMAIAGHQGYTTRFATELVKPGLRIPITADAKLFEEAAGLGREVIWLHTVGDRFASPKDGRPAGPPRLPVGERPQVPAGGTIPSAADQMPATITYDATIKRLSIGTGYIDNVSPAVWAYEVSGRQVLTQWFSYRGRDRTRPMIGDRRAPSPLGAIQPEGWLSEYTTELLNVLNVLGLLVKLEPKQADILQRVCAEATISDDDLKAVAPTEQPEAAKKPPKRRNAKQGELLR